MMAIGSSVKNPNLYVHCNTNYKKKNTNYKNHAQNGFMLIIMDFFLVDFVKKDVHFLLSENSLSINWSLTNKFRFFYE